MVVEAKFLNTYLRAVLLAVVLTGLAACSEPASTEDETTATAPGLEADADRSAGDKHETTAGQLTAARMAQWSRNCALCHIRGEGGAPVLGDRAAWTERLAKGEETLLENTVAGLNNMPPLGYCMDCEADDFLALIRFMGGER